MSAPKSPKLVKVSASGCSPGNLELFKGWDSVAFIQSGPGAPATIHVSDASLFGTTTCSVGKSAADAKVYPALAPGNYNLGITLGAGSKGTVQVLCLTVPGAMGASDSGSIKVSR